MEIGSFGGGGLGFGLAFTLEDQFTAAAEDIQRSMRGLEGTSAELQSQVTTSMNQLKLGAVALGVGMAIAAPFGLGLKYASEFETAEVGLATALKSTEAAKAAFAQIKADAAATPFDTQSLLAGNRALISTGMTAQAAREDILNLANAVAGSGGGSVELQRMAINMQQISNLGKASSVDIKQFAIAGINIYQLLAEATGKPIAKVKEMDVTYSDLSKALKIAAQEGGVYAGALEKMSQTAAGKSSTLKDEITFAFAALGTAVFPIFHGVIDLLISASKAVRIFLENPLGQWIARITLGVAALSIGFGLLLIVMGGSKLVAIQMAGAFGSATKTMILETIATQGLTAGLGAMATAAWAAIAPLLPFIAIGALVVAIAYGIYAGYNKATEAFANFANECENSGVTLFFARLGGYLQVIKEVWQTWDGLTNSFSLSQETIQKLQALGIYETALGIATWTLRIKEFFVSSFTVIRSVAVQTWGIVQRIWNSISTSIDDALGKFGISIGKNTSDLEKWRKAGEIVGGAIVRGLAGIAIVAAVVSSAVVIVFAGIVLAIEAVISVFYTAWKVIGMAFDVLSARVTGFLGLIKSVGIFIYDVFVGIFDAISVKFQSVVDGLKSAFDWIVSIFATGINGISSAISSVSSFLGFGDSNINVSGGQSPVQSQGQYEIGMAAANFAGTTAYNSSNTTIINSDTGGANRNTKIENIIHLDGREIYRSVNQQDIDEQNRS
jgi:tape measure domain-containing protein